MVYIVKNNCYLVCNDRIIQKILHQQNLIVNIVVMNQFDQFWYGFKDLICSFQKMEKMLQLDKLLVNYNQIEWTYKNYV